MIYLFAANPQLMSNKKTVIELHNGADTVGAVPVMRHGGLIAVEGTAREAMLALGTEYSPPQGCIKS